MRRSSGRRSMPASTSSAATRRAAGTIWRPWGTSSRMSSSGPSGTAPLVPRAAAGSSSSSRRPSQRTPASSPGVPARATTMSSVSSWPRSRNALAAGGRRRRSRRRPRPNLGLHSLPPSGRAATRTSRMPCGSTLRPSAVWSIRRSRTTTNCATSFPTCPSRLRSAGGPAPARGRLRPRPGGGPGPRRPIRKATKRATWSTTRMFAPTTFRRPRPRRGRGGRPRRAVGPRRPQLRRLKLTRIAMSL
mmetsp:Transcript_3389/g.7796  ORF Transcript_3389/g.7796 Transcript_3389/m.7796 type:complete len:246 (+) Transcript_3389:691-1428(+)